MSFISRVKIIAWVFTAALVAPTHKKMQEYNYSNGDIGSNALGSTAAEAADIEQDLPLGTPILKSIEILAEPSVVLDSEKNSQESLDSSNKQE